MTLRIFGLLASLIFSAQVFAHGSHGAPISDEKAKAVAVSVAHHFAGKDPQLGFGKLSESWATVGAAESQVVTKRDGYFILQVSNPESDKTLFVLMDSAGDVYDANLTGDFPGIE